MWLEVAGSALARLVWTDLGSLAGRRVWRHYMLQSRSCDCETKRSDRIAMLLLVVAHGGRGTGLVNLFAACKPGILANEATGVPSYGPAVHLWLYTK